MAGKWNYKTKRYDNYQPPYGATTYETDMDKVVECASCGKKIVFGNGYTSRTIHTEHGMGYVVCSSCYEQERAEENRYNKTNRGEK